MSIESANDPATPEDAAHEAIPVADRDYFLQYLIGLANDSTKSWIPVTLSVNGMLVSGTLASAKEYFAEMAETISTTVYGLDVKDVGVKDAKAKFADHILAFAPPSDGSASFTDANYVHVRNAKFFAASGEPLNIMSSLIWRGRITAVNGWNYGRLEVASKAN